METVTLKALASEIGMDRSHLRKFVLSLGLTPLRIRNESSGNQATLAVTQEEAQSIRFARTDAGFMPNRERAKPVNTEDGVFYIVLPDPEARPYRIKIGFTGSIHNRMQDYATSNPGVQLVDSTPCKKSWESAWIALLTSPATCQRVAGEIYDCTNIGALQQRLIQIAKMAKPEQ